MDSNLIFQAINLAKNNKNNFNYFLLKRELHIGILTCNEVLEELAEKGIKTLPASLWEAYHALEKDDVVKSALGDHTYNKFMEIKKAEWDDYRVQVFDYEVDKYIDI